MIKLSVILYASILYHGAFEYRTGNPDMLFPIQTAVHDISSPSVMMTPALLPFAEGLLLNSSTGRPYSEEALTTGSISAQYGSGDQGMQLSWNCFGGDFYREHTFSMKGGYSIFPFIHAGISGNLYMVKIDTDEFSDDITVYDTDFALLFTPFTWINAGFIQTGIISLLKKENCGLIYPERSTGIIIRPGRGFSVSWNITDTAVEKVNIFAASINPVSFLTLKGGYCRENSSMAVSIGISAMDFFVTYGLKYHPFLGYTHAIGLTYALNSEVESLAYRGVANPPGVKKINVITAGSDDLKKINGISARSAERIILYREKIGPVNEKALMQIGLTADEIKIFEANTYGMERTPRSKDGEKNFKKYVKQPPRKERIKQKFRKLINAGIPAYTAINYSELSESADTTGFYNRLGNDSSLNDDQKKLIEKTCLK